MLCVTMKQARTRIVMAGLAVLTTFGSPQMASAGAAAVETQVTALPHGGRVLFGPAKSQKHTTARRDMLHNAMILLAQGQSGRSTLQYKGNVVQLGTPARTFWVTVPSSRQQVSIKILHSGAVTICPLIPKEHVQAAKKAATSRRDLADRLGNLASVQPAPPVSLVDSIKQTIDIVDAQPHH